MSAVSDALSRNRILSALPSAERKIIEQHIEVFQVHLGDVLDHPGEIVRYLYFPVDAAISMMDVKDSSHTLDVALIGAEGCSGASVAQASDASPCLNIVEIGGWTVRIHAPSLAESLPKLPFLSAVLSRYNLLLMRHTVISVGCSQFHSPEQRIARWLLAHKHRTGLTVFPFTSDFLAAQVGIDKHQVRSILDEMQKRGLLTKSHQSVAINHEALVHQSCACLQLTQEATDGYLETLTRLSRAYLH